MYKKIFPKHEIEAKHREGMLGAYFGIFSSWMQEQGSDVLTQTEVPVIHDLPKNLAGPLRMSTNRRGLKKRDHKF